MVQFAECWKVQPVVGRPFAEITWYPVTWNTLLIDTNKSLQSITMNKYSHGQELFYEFVSKITNKLVKQLLSMIVECLF